MLVGFILPAGTALLLRTFGMVTVELLGRLRLKLECMFLTPFYTA